MKNMSDGGNGVLEMNPVHSAYQNAKNDEEYSGEGEAKTPEITARRAGSVLSQFMSGSNWYDRLFAEQVDQNCGKLRVSKLMEIVKMNVDVTNANDLNRLEMMLDPVGNDIFIDAETFRAIILSWESEQLESGFSNNVTSDGSFTTAMDNIHSYDVTKLTFKYENDFSSETFNIDSFAVESDNAQLKFLNKRLVAENTQLEAQCSTLEETNDCLRTEVVKLRTKLQTLQCCLQECQDELTTLTCKNEEDLFKLKSECSHLANEKNKLESMLKSTKEKLTVALAELKKCDMQNEDLKRETLEQEMVIVDLSSQCETLQETVNQITEECSQYKETLLEILSSNEDLRNEQQSLKDEISRLYEAKWLNEIGNLPTEQMLTDDLSDFEESVEINSPIVYKVHSGLTLFVDCEVDSLYDELRDSLSPSDDGSQQFMPKMFNSFGTFESQYQECLSDDMADGSGHDSTEHHSIHTEDRFKVSDSRKHNRTIEDVSSKVKRSSRHYDYFPPSRHDAWFYRTSEIDKHAIKGIEADNQTGLLVNASTESIPDQISKELQMLRIHIAKSEAYLATLSRASKIPLLKELLKQGRKGTETYDDLSYERNLHWATHQNTALYHHAKCLHKCYTYTAPSSSHSSTPQHCRIRSRSCPLLPSQTSLVTKSTQTEPVTTSPLTELHLVAVTSGTCPYDTAASNIPTFVKASSKLFDSSRLHFHNLPISSAIANESSTSSDDTSPPVTLALRNRNYSFAQAISHAVDHNIDGASLLVVEKNELERSGVDTDRNIVMVTASTNTVLSSTSSDEDSDEFRVTHSPRKLSVLKEEEHEDSESALSKSPPSALVTSSSSLVSTQRPLRTVPCISEIIGKPSINVSVYNQNMPGPQLFPRQPPPYRPPPPVGGRAYYSSENVSHPLTISHLVTDQSSKSFDNLPTTLSQRLSPATLLPVMPDPLTFPRLRAMPPPVRQFSDPFPHSSAGPPILPYSDGQYLLPSEPPTHSVSAQHLNYYASSSWHAAVLSSSDPTPNPDLPEYRQPPVYSSRQHSLSPQASCESEAQSNYDYFLRPEETECFEIQIPLKPTSVVEVPPQTKRKSGLTLKEPPKMVVTAELHPVSRQEKADDDSDEDTEKNIISRVGSRRRRRSSGSLVSSPAIQRAKAVDFDFDVTEDQMYPPPDTSPPKKDDSDFDVKRDILEGMTQATSCASRQPPSISEPVTATTPAVPSRSSSESHDHKLRRRTVDSNKSRLLMPELMENSETESAKNSGGSIESEAEPPAAPTIEEKKVVPPPPSGDGPFPSLPDSFLKKLELHPNSKERSDQLTDSDIEIKFNSLCLAFKTDRFTLTNRLELHQRQRDLAEKNVDDEIVALKENLNVLSQICSDEETRKLVKNLHHHLEVLNQSTARMSSRAEVYGAVQQEERTNRAIEVMLTYVENLKRCHEKNNQELEEMKRILTENNLLNEETNEPDEGRRAIRTYSMSAVGVGKPSSRRRASIAALPRSADRLDGKTKFATFVANAASRNSMCNIDTRRCPQVYSIQPFVTQDDPTLLEKSRTQATDDQLVNGNRAEQNNNENLCDANELPRTSPPSSEVIFNKLQDVTEKCIVNDSLVSDGKNNHPPLKIGSSSVDVKTNRSWFSDGRSDNSSSSPNHESFNTFTLLQDAQQSYLTDQTDQEEEDEQESAGVQKITTKASSDHSAAHIPVTFAFVLKRWSHYSDYWQNSFRYGFCAFLFMAAICILLLTFMPSSTSAYECEPRTWHSMEELLQSQLHLRHVLRPPT